MFERAPSMADKPVGVVLLYMGGPATLDDVRPFLRQLFSDRELIQLPGGRVLQRPFAWLISKLRAPRVRRYYAEIGGGSPLGRITTRQAELLQAALGPAGKALPVAVAMRYCAPRADDALATLAAAGVRRCVALPLYPQFSRATTGSSLRDLERAAGASGLELEIASVQDFHVHPLYLDALAGKVREGLAGLGGDPCVVFSAHSLPQRMIDAGDPYERQVRATVAGVVERLGLRDWHLGFQSRSGPVRWLEPEVVALLERLIAEGRRRLLVVAVSFVSDHIETLHEIDRRMGPHCLARGAVAFVRAASLNDDPRFIAALAQLVTTTCAQNGWTA
jgi:protoporphyrin/coproporphyrin ferrochelatase